MLKSLKVGLSSLMLGALVIASTNSQYENIVNAEGKEEPAVVMSKSDVDFKEKVKNEIAKESGKVVLVSSENVTDEDLASLDAKVGLKDKKGGVSIIGVFEDKGEVIPLFITSNSKLSDEEYQFAAEKVKDTYLKKHINEGTSIKNKEKNEVGVLANPNASYGLQDSALHLYVSDNGEQYWYTEYLIYKDINTTNLDAYYLRADHENLDTRYGGGWNDYSLYRMTAEWIPQAGNVDTRDPEPGSTENKNSYTLSLPYGISWTTELGGSVDIETDHSIESNRAYWELDDWQLTDFYVMEDFSFSHGVEVESPTHNNGFTMDVTYKLWGDQPYLGISHDDWWTDSIYILDNTGDVGWDD